MQSDSPVAHWQKLAAAILLAAVVAVVVIFRSRLHADFVPLDSSRVAPNILANVIASAVLFVAAILLWPPFRRRLHLFVDRKLAPLHERVAELHARHDQHAEHIDRLGRSLVDLHAKVDQLGKKPATKKPPRPKPPV